MRQYFSGNDVIPSPKSNEDQKRKRSSPQFGTIIGRNLRDLFVLTCPFSSDHLTLKFRWGDANSRWGDAKYRWEDANSRWGTRPPYNLSTAFRCHQSRSQGGGYIFPMGLSTKMQNEENATFLALLRLFFALE